MELTLKNRQGKITEAQRQHIEEKLSKLGRYMGQITNATVEVHTEQRRNAGEVHRVQVTLTGDRGVILRAEEQASDLYGAIDEVQGVLQRQIQRYKEKYWRRDKQRRQSDRLIPPDVVAATDVADTEPSERDIIRTKQFRLRPMFTDDAVEQMELLGHSFFVFQDAETSQLSVLYRRRDGNYGVIIPETT